MISNFFLFFQSSNQVRSSFLFCKIKWYWSRTRLVGVWNEYRRGKEKWNKNVHIFECSYRVFKGHRRSTRSIRIIENRCTLFLVEKKKEKKNEPFRRTSRVHWIKSTFGSCKQGNLRGLWKFNYVVIIRRVVPVRACFRLHNYQLEYWQ